MRQFLHIGATETAFSFPSQLGGAMHDPLRDLRDCEEGATALEYAVMASFIAAACAVAVGLFGKAVAALFSVNL